MSTRDQRYIFCEISPWVALLVTNPPHVDSPYSCGKHFVNVLASRLQRCKTTVISLKNCNFLYFKEKNKLKIQLLYINNYFLTTWHLNTPYSTPSIGFEPTQGYSCHPKKNTSHILIMRTACQIMWPRDTATCPTWHISKWT